MKFRMVDRITSFRPRESIRGVKTVSFEEYQLKAPLSDEPRLPESLLLESLFQLGNWLIVLSSEFSRMGLLVRIQQVQFHGAVRPGRSVEMDVRVKRYRDDGVLFDGQAFVGDDVIAVGSGCLATCVPLGAYHDPSDVKVLFSEIYRP
jgi:3-hydroxyacyl-[acyl-carrier-protein] dehydratase